MPLKGHGAKFGRKKEAAIAALLTQSSVVAAARSAEIGVATLRRWMKDTQFDAAYRKARREVYLQDTARLKQLRGNAITTLETLMTDPAVPPSSRIRVALAVVALADHAVEVEADKPPETRLSQEESVKATALALQAYREHLMEMRRLSKIGDDSKVKDVCEIVVLPKTSSFPTL